VPAIRVESHAFIDSRYRKLGRMLALELSISLPGWMAEALGMGIALKLWNACVELETEVLDGDMIEKIVDVDGAASVIVRSGLAEIDLDGYRIRGSAKPVKKRRNQRSAAAKGGAATKDKWEVHRGPSGRPTGKPTGGPVGPPEVEEVPAPKPAESPKALALAVAGVERLNELTGRKFKPEGATLKAFGKIAKQSPRPSAADVVAVVEAKVSEWMRNPEMRGQLKPGVLFRPVNFERYLADIDGAAPPDGNGDVRDDIDDYLSRTETDENRDELDFLRGGAK
jgi:uncharacterized phage protein (TIGR02220 family)